MVSDVAISMASLETEVADSDDDDDDDSVSTGTSISETANNSVVIFDDAHKQDDCMAFGNVAITNSSDVHFGNKTYYQGPVTIKQFLYANSVDAGLNSLKERNGDVSNCESEVIRNCVGENDKSEDEIRKRNCDGGMHNGDGPVKNNVHQTENEKEKDAHFCSKKTSIIFGMATLLFILLSVAILCALLLVPNTAEVAETSKNTVSESNEQDIILEQPNIDFSKNVSFPKKLKIISRIEWIAQPPLQEVSNLTLPVPIVIISHTATEGCTKIALCVLIVRHIQSFHIESRGWWDIGYNFLVAGDGNAYMGRGWNKEGAHTYGYNTKSIGISFIGTFTNVKPPPQQIAACKYLIEKGVELGYIAKDYKLLAARQLQTTESPGQMLYEEMKSWPHWVESYD